VSKLWFENCIQADSKSTQEYFTNIPIWTIEEKIR